MQPSSDVESVALHLATRQRYLNYALSVITARALPDVRDGLKPVQRRILYAMHHNLSLGPDKRYRKSAAVVGEVMAKYHPHGDSSIYDAMVRMAQPFSLRHPLIDGQGNFGSMDGDSAAAMRYTECRLRHIAVELLSEIGQRTVDFRPNYDGQHQEPVVLPARFPQLLVNGSEGIAVGMATRIPPHNLREVIDAAVLLVDDPDVGVARLCKKLKGPDFPTGGAILNTREELRKVYETGRGSISLRGEWAYEKVGRKHLIIITAIPFAVNKATMVEKIGGLIADRKVPQLVDVRDESTEDVRVVLELRKPQDQEAAMAFLCKHTPLQINFPVNLTCLVPGDEEGLPSVPLRADLREILRFWLDFRYATVERRFRYELEKLRERIHILEGFAILFDALDEAIALIRASEGRRDAHERLIERFDLSDAQTEKILEMQLYRLTRGLILAMLEELDSLRRQAAEIEAILASPSELWRVVKDELLEVRKEYGERRRTTILGESAGDLEFNEADYIVAEDTFLIVTRDGWIKRQGSFTDIEKIRTREGDSVGWLSIGNTKTSVTFITDLGGAYTMRLDDVPATTGYGEPIQRHFKFADGERVVGVAVHDPRALPGKPSQLGLPLDVHTSPPHLVAVTRAGRIIRASLAALQPVSNRTGRRFARPGKRPDGLVAAWVSDGTEQVSIATEKGRALTFPVEQANLLKGAGKGVLAIKLEPNDRVLAFSLSRDRMEGCLVTTSNGRDEVVRPNKFEASRAGKGRAVLRRGRFVTWQQDVHRDDVVFAASEE
ncbi:MAG: DNA topoisomerase IV subunit A [Myxococcota bacterium]|nr:DNA topoisomerase IV subunit A [Myxococcota bacterium]